MYESESYPPELIEQIRSYAMLGYSIEKIIALVDPNDPDRLRLDFDTPETVIYIDDLIFKNFELS